LLCVIVVLVNFERAINKLHILQYDRAATAAGTYINNVRIDEDHIYPSKPIKYLSAINDGIIRNRLPQHSGIPCRYPYYAEYSIAVKRNSIKGNGRKAWWGN
jgi:hypothetical protein